jgi:hypothetical protein
MRRIVLGTLWVVKGFLLAIALGALGLWPWSYGHRLSIALEQYHLQPERVENVRFNIAWRDGRVFMTEVCNKFDGAWLASAHEQAIACGARWHWTMGSGERLLFYNAFDHSCGPLRWSSYTYVDQTDRFGSRGASFPMWLLALLSATWPLTSLTFLPRRGSRRRRGLANAGCCVKCDYDLRATPDRCPECGVAPSKLGSVP